MNFLTLVFQNNTIWQPLIPSHLLTWQISPPETLRAKPHFVEQLGKAYEEVGFVAVRNHGIPADLIADLYRYVQEFFAQPSDIKGTTRYLSWPASAVTTSFGKEHAKGFFFF